TRSKRDWSSDVCSSDLRIMCLNMEFAQKSNGSKKKNGLFNDFGDLIMSHRQTMKLKYNDVLIDIGSKLSKEWSFSINKLGQPLRSEERRVGKESGVQSG